MFQQEKGELVFSFFLADFFNGTARIRASSSCWVGKTVPQTREVCRANFQRFSEPQPQPARRTRHLSDQQLNVKKSIGNVQHLAAMEPEEEDQNARKGPRREDHRISARSAALHPNGADDPGSRHNLTFATTYQWVPHVLREDGGRVQERQFGKNWSVFENGSRIQRTVVGHTHLNVLFRWDPRLCAVFSFLSHLLVTFQQFSM